MTDHTTYTKGEAAREDSEYTQAELDCRGCSGPCGNCEVTTEGEAARETGCGHDPRWIMGGTGPGATQHCAACAYEGRIAELEAENARTISDQSSPETGLIGVPEGGKSLMLQWRDEANRRQERIAALEAENERLTEANRVLMEFAKGFPGPRRVMGSHFTCPSCFSDWEDDNLGISLSSNEKFLI